MLFRSALILKSFSADENQGFESLAFGNLKEGSAVFKLPPIFPRIDVKKELAEVEKLVSDRQRKEKKEEKKEKKTVENSEKLPEIAIDDFFKVELKVGEVIACEKVEKSNKLLHETVRIGNETRSIVSGIAKYYTPEEMVGKKVVVVTNLKPAKLCGVLSEGMLLCAESADGTLALLTPESAVESGAKVG